MYLSDKSWKHRFTRIFKTIMALGSSRAATYSVEVPSGRAYCSNSGTDGEVGWGSCTGAGSKSLDDRWSWIHWHAASTCAGVPECIIIFNFLLFLIVYLKQKIVQRQFIRLRTNIKTCDEYFSNAVGFHPSCMAWILLEPIALSRWLCIVCLFSLFNIFLPVSERHLSPLTDEALTLIPSFLNSFKFFPCQEVIKSVLLPCHK